jgi:hypothetical protein
MYGEIAKYFKDAYRVKCDVYINPRRLLRKVRKLPDLLIVPAKEAAELIAVEAKREADAVSFSQALGRGMELREFASQVYLAFNEPTPDRFQRDLVTLVAPKTGLLSRTSDGRILRLRLAKKETPRKLDRARELKEFLHWYPNYLRAEQRARVEGRKHLAEVMEGFKEFIEGEKTFTNVKGYWYDLTTNIVQVTIDDTLDDQQPFAEAVDKLDADMTELNRRSGFVCVEG